MTREEFTKGWTLLIIQPWGKRYAVQDIPSRLQFEFYYNRLGRFQAEAWEVACGLFASGDKWPSADEMRHAINQSLPSRYQITHDPKWVEKPELLVKIDAYQHAKSCTVLEAAESVLPSYAAEHPGPEHDEPIARCEQLIKALKAHRAHVQVMKQEKAAGAQR